MSKIYSLNLPIAKCKSLDQIGLVFIISIWLSMILLPMPCHRSLSSGYSITTIKRLVQLVANDFVVPQSSYSLDFLAVSI